MMDEHRRTGRTHRALSQAIKRAQDGAHVLFYVPWGSMLEYARSMAEDILGAVIDRNGRSPALAGSLRFAIVGWREPERGYRDLVVIYDHSCFDNEVRLRRDG